MHPCGHTSLCHATAPSVGCCLRSATSFPCRPGQDPEPEPEPDYPNEPEPEILRDGRVSISTAAPRPTAARASVQPGSVEGMPGAPPGQETAPEAVGADRGAISDGQDWLAERTESRDAAVPASSNSLCAEAVRPAVVRAGTPLVPSAYAAEKTTGRRPVAQVAVYPTGVRLKRLDRLKRPAPKVSRKRGRITGYSAGASARLRKFCMENTVVGKTACGFTLAPRANFTPAESAAHLTAMEKWCNTESIPVVLRRARQARGAEHDHGAAYFDDEAQKQRFRKQWLKITGEGGDPKAQRHAVRFKPEECPRDAADRMVYLSRRGERPVESGKQWSVWGRQLFSTVTPEVVVFATDSQLHKFRRPLERLLVSPKAKKKRKRHLPAYGNFRRATDGPAALRLAQAALGTPANPSSPLEASTVDGRRLLMGPRQAVNTTGPGQGIGRTLGGPPLAAVGVRRGSTRLTRGLTLVHQGSDYARRALRLHRRWWKQLLDAVRGTANWHARASTMTRGPPITVAAAGPVPPWRSYVSTVAT
jgi:hypothetical protein